MIGRFLAMAVGGLALASCASVPAPDARRTEPTRFLCDRGEQIAIIFEDREAVLSHGAGSVRLRQQPVGSGFLYVDGGQLIRGKGAELTWTKSDGISIACREEKWAMSQPQIQPPGPTLSGTRWALVQFQSMDDAIGAVVPPSLDRYTLEFGADGRLSMQLDCNRASAGYSTNPQSRTGGSMAIQVGVMTRAMCQPGAMDTRIARDLSRIRSYTLRGDRLFLALEADGGVYEYRRI